jgi:hypothetical protein
VNGTIAGRKRMSVKIARILCFIGLLCLLPFPAQAQNITTVTATITDPNGLPYSGASVQAQLVPTGITPTLNGQQVASFTRATADATGTFSMNLASNAIILPGGTQWQFTVSESPGIAPPAGFGPQSFVVTLTISGASQSISASLSAAATALGRAGGASSFPVTTPVTVNSGGSISPAGTGTINATSSPTSASGSQSSVATFFPATSTACTLSVYSATGTNYCMINAITGAVTTNTDFRPLWDAALTAFPNGGLFLFKQGIYNCNTLDSESTGGFSNAYCVGFPSGGTTQYQKWILEGEIEDQIIDQFVSTVQTGGVIINLTAAARATVTATRKITLLWARKDVTNGIGPSVRLVHLGLRIPDNQRGCETFSDLSNALNAEYDHVFADTAVSQNSLLFPVQTACTAWGFTDPGGLMGLTSTDSSKEHTDFNWSYTMGADVGFDVRTEHSSFEQSAAVDGNHCIDYGVRGFAIFHSSFWQSIGCGETARALTLGVNMQLGSALTVFGFDIEDAQNGGSQTIFQPVYHFAETNAGATNGLISYSDTLQNIGLQGLLNVFDGGGGSSFTILQATSQHNLARTPGTDTFTRANIVGLGPAWAVATLNANTLKISGNTAQCNSAATVSCAAIFLGETFANTDQFSQVTVNTIDANASSNIQAITNLSNSAITFYAYFCSGAAATGSGIYKRVAGATTTLSSQTAVIGCANGDIVKLAHIGTWLYGFRNGVLDKNFTPNPVSDSSITGGNPGFELAQDTAGGAAITNFIGGQFPTITGADSIYSPANPTFTPFLLSIGTAPTLTGTGACATITTQVPAVLGDRAGKFTCTGVTAASTITLTFTNVTPDDHQCNFSDRTTRANVITQTSGSTTTCVATATSITANDVISWNQEPF